MIDPRDTHAMDATAPLDEDYEDYIDPMAPLKEEEDAPALTGVETVPSNNPTHRRLRAIAGAGVPYVFLTFPEGQVGMDFWGVRAEDLYILLYQAAHAVAAQTEGATL